MQAYAAAFFAIPLVRFLLNKQRNAAIENRNQARMYAAASLDRPVLRRKLAAAAKLANKTVIDDRDLVYSSDRCRLSTRSALMASHLSSCVCGGLPCLAS